MINSPSRGIGETTIERIEKHALAIGFKFHVAARNWKKAGEISDKLGENIDKFFKILDNLPEIILRRDITKSVGAILLEELRAMGYRDHLMQTCKDLQTLEKKWAILEIFARVLDSFVDKGGRTEKTLHEFIDAMELRDAGEDPDEKDKTPKVQLLTLHACKGLEFPVVIFIGVEEDLLPHRTLGSDVSEERRLFYVGVTRAKQRLVMTRAKDRKRFGKWQPVAASRFLLEIPPSMVTTFDSGFRPVAEAERKNMLADLLKKLDVTAEKQKVSK